MKLSASHNHSIDIKEIHHLENYANVGNNGSNNYKTIDMHNFGSIFQQCTYRREKEEKDFEKKIKKKIRSLFLFIRLLAEEFIDPFLEFGLSLRAFLPGFVILI
jgi:hypothetical protein